MTPLLRAYLIIAAGVCAALHIAKISPALPVLSETFNLTATQAGFLISSVQLAGMLLGLITGAWVESFGRRRGIILGLTLLTISSFLGLLSPSASTLLLLRCIEGVGFLLVVMPAPAMIRDLIPPKQLSAIMGIWGAYMPIGTAMSLFIGTLIISGTNWKVWWLSLSVITALTLVVCIKYLPLNDAHKMTTADVPPQSHLTKTRLPFLILMSRIKLTLSSLAPWVVAIAFGMYSAQWLTIVGFLPTIYTQIGITGVMAGLITALVASANIIGNVYAGRLIARQFFAPHILYAAFGTMCLCAFIAFATLNYSASWLTWVRFVAIFIFSAMGGLIPGCLFYLAIELAPSNDTVSTTVGWAQQLSSTGQFLIPPVVGILADANHGDWQWTWVVLCACSILGLMAAKVMANLMRKVA